MALDFNNIQKWTDENAMALIKEAVLKGRTVDLVTVQGGIKHKATINTLSTDLSAQAGACGWNTAGTTDLEQRDIEVFPVKVNEAICLNKLEDYYTSVMMNPGSYNTEIPFEQLFAENKRDQIMGLVEDLIWKGDTDTGSGNLALADGFVKLFDAGITASSDYYGSYTASTFGANAVDIIDEMAATINPNIIDAEDLHVFMGYAEYRAYAKALRDANLFAYTGAENQGLDFSQMHPGTNIRVVAIRGLNNTNRLLLVPASSLVVGTDLLNDAEDFRIFYSQDFDEVRFLAKFKIGCNITFLNHAVWFVGV